MTIARVRVTLFWVFIVFLVVQLAAVVLTYIKGEVYADELLSPLGKLIAIYSVPFAVILGGVFGQRRAKKAQSSVFWIAFCLTLVWNLILAWRSIAFALMKEDSEAELSKYLDAMAIYSSSLIAGLLSYLFTSSD